MSIDEAIAHAREVAEEQRKECALAWVLDNPNNIKQCAEEHEQLAEWLEELKELRNMTAGHLYAVAFNRGYLKAEKEVREKAIEDFVEAFKNKTSMENMLVDEIAEQLKAGEDNV